MQETILSPLLPLLPPELCRATERLEVSALEELRLRVGRLPCAVIAGREQVLRVSETTRAQLEQIVGAASGHSSFAALGDGFLTLPGGHRLGFCGEAVMKEGKISSFRALSSVNLRLARQITGLAEPIVTVLRTRMENTLLVGPPGSGKTTVLRDLIRLCSDKLGQRVAVADERGELAAVREGKPMFDVGQHTDVLTGGMRSQALELLLRVMNPTVLAMDEIVSEEEIRALRHAGRCGVILLATVHAADCRELRQKPQLRELQELFPNLVQIGRNTIRMERW